MIRLKKLHCSFCRKDEQQVSKLVAGPHVYICDECVAIASQIMKGSRDDTQPPAVERSAWRKLLARTQRVFRNSGSQLVGRDAESTGRARAIELGSSA